MVSNGDKSIVMTFAEKATVALLKRLRAITVLTYHEITDEPSEFLGPNLITSTKRFEQEMAWIRENFPVLSLEEVLGKLRGGQIEEAAFVITFDDGFKGVCKNACPVLHRYSIPSTMFVSGAFVMGEEISWEFKAMVIEKKCDPNAIRQWFPDWCLEEPLHRHIKRNFSLDRLERLLSIYPREQFPEKLYAQEDDLEKLDDGLLSISNHTQNHYVMSALSQLEQEREIFQSHDMLSGLSHYRPYIALPFGLWNKDSFSPIRKYGEGLLITGNGGIIRRIEGPDDLIHVTRNGVGNDKPPLVTNLWRKWVRLRLGLSLAGGKQA